MHVARGSLVSSLDLSRLVEGCARDDGCLRSSLAFVSHMKMTNHTTDASCEDALRQRMALYGCPKL